MEKLQVANSRNCTYIAADFDHDIDAVRVLYHMKNIGLLTFIDAHKLQQCKDSIYPCMIKKILQYRIDHSKSFILIVGNQTTRIQKGTCRLCKRYNNQKYICRIGNKVDHRSYIKYECDKAIEAGIEISVLYKHIIINRSLCPSVIRWSGKHKNMLYVGRDDYIYWNYDGIIKTIIR